MTIIFERVRVCWFDLCICVLDFCVNMVLLTFRAVGLMEVK